MNRNCVSLRCVAPAIVEVAYESLHRYEMKPRFRHRGPRWSPCSTKHSHRGKLRALTVETVVLESLRSNHTRPGSYHEEDPAHSCDSVLTRIGRFAWRRPSPFSWRPAKVSVPRIVGEYVNVYKPAGDIFPGPSAAELVAGRFHDDWIPNDHCFVRDTSGRWHAFGITHPLTDVSNVHAGEHLLFHAIAPRGTVEETLKERSWKDLPKILPPQERPGGIPAIHAPSDPQTQRSVPHNVWPDAHSVRHVNELNDWTPIGTLL